MISNASSMRTPGFAVDVQEHASLSVHGIVIIAMIIHGVIGSYMGWRNATFAAWVPVSIILSYSLLNMLRPKKAIVSIPEFQPIIIALLILVVWRLIGYFWAVFIISSFKECLKTVYLLVFVLSTQYVVTRTTREKLLNMVTFLVTFCLVASLISYIYQLTYSGGIHVYASKSFKGWIRLFYGGNLAGGVIMLIGLWNWIIVFSGGRYIKFGMMNLFITLFLLVGIASQAALGGFLVSVSVVLLYYFYSIRDRMLLFYISNVAAITLAVFSVYYVIESTTIQQLTTLNGRLGIWIEALGVLREGAWLKGIGSGASYWLTSETNIGARNVHNLLIYSLASGGIIELLVVLFVFAWIARIAMLEIQGSGIALLALIAGAFVRSQAESGGFLFGYFNSSWIFLSWYVVISTIVLIKRRAPDEDINSVRQETLRT